MKRDRPTRSVFLYASLLSFFLRVLVLSVRLTRKKNGSNVTPSAIDNRRCFCSRGGRHFDTPVAQQRSHTRSLSTFFFRTNFVRRDVENKKSEKDRLQSLDWPTARSLGAGTRVPNTATQQSEQRKHTKEYSVSFVVENAHTTSNKVSFTDGSESETFLPVSSSSNTADSPAIMCVGHRSDKRCYQVKEIVGPPSRATATNFRFKASRAMKPRGTQKSRTIKSLAFIIRPTLSQMWPEREAGPPFTFKISMLHVFCSSHGLAHFAALFIDPRA